ncbi:hypothetical protein QYF36_002330 [Acer negundo]|nr:hypothetical protein QYF36_002330 [Acer negundo]
MWVSTIKLFSLRKYIKHIRFQSVSALAQLKPSSSYSDFDSQDREQMNIKTFGLNTVTVVENLNCLKNEPNAAISHFENLKRIGFLHDVYTYAAFVRILCCWRFNNKLSSVFMEIVRKSNNIDFEVTDLLEAIYDDGSNSFVLASNAMVKAYVSLRMFDQVIDIFFPPKRHGFVFSILSLNFLMSQLIHCEKMDMARFVYQQLKRLGLSLNHYTYNLAVKALCKIGSLEEAAEVFEDMDKAGVTPNAFAYSTYIEGLCMNGKSDSGYQLLREWRVAKVPLDTFAYTIVIRGFCNENRLKEAAGVLLDMEKHGVVPNVYVYGELISWYCRYGKISKALYIHNKMMSKGIETNSVTVSVLLKCLFKLGMNSEALSQFEEFKKSGIFVDRVCYNLVLDALCKLGKVEEAMRLFNEMKKKQIVPDVVNYTTLINGYCCQGKLLDAFNLFKEMKDTAHEPNLVTCNILASGLARCGYVKKVYDFLDYMKTLGLKPNTVTLNMIIEGLCLGGKVKEAEAFLDSLQEKCLENYLALCNGYCEANSLEKAFQLFMRLSSHGIIVRKGSCCKIVYEKLIDVLCRAREMGKARMVFDILIDRGFSPDLLTYTHMIKSYFKVNCSREACDLFNDMKRRGIKPDLVTYKVLFNAHSKINPKSSSSLPDAIQNTVSWTTFKKLLVFDEMIDRGLEPDIVRLTTLLSGYFAGDVDKPYLGHSWSSCWLPDHQQTAICLDLQLAEDECIFARLLNNVLVFVSLNIQIFKEFNARKSDEFRNN